MSTWTATGSQPGVASAIDPTELVREVQQVRRTADTVIVYVHWGTETQACPNPQQEPLAQQLVKAGADIVIGSGTHVLLGGGYLGSAYVDYGLGNFAFYDDAAPETSSGSLIITAEGRHITGVVFRPATILAGLPQPLSGAPAATALQSWNAARGCTGLSATPSTSAATMRGETVAFVAPPTTTTTTTAPGSAATTTTPSTLRARRPQQVRVNVDQQWHRRHDDHDTDHARLDHHLPHRQRRLTPSDGLGQPRIDSATVRPGRSWTRCGASPRSTPRRGGVGNGTGSPRGRSARLTVSSDNRRTMSAWRRSTVRWSAEVVSSMIEPRESMSRMRTAGIPRADWRILSKARLTMRA